MALGPNAVPGAELGAARATGGAAARTTGGAAARTACRHGIPTTHTQQVDRQGGNMLLQQNATTLVLSWQ